MSMLKQKPGKSKQDYRTPLEFLESIQTNLLQQRFVFDLAADAENTVVPTTTTPVKYHYDMEDDALLQSWVKPGWAWCNPPFGNLYDWTEKAAQERYRGAQVVMLVPASVSTEWWDHNVHNIAMAYFIRPRLTFVGEKDPYPKDLAILLYAPHICGGYQPWEWK